MPFRIRLTIVHYHWYRKASKNVEAKATYFVGELVGSTAKY